MTSPTRIKLGPSSEDLDCQPAEEPEEHCTICLQSFLDKTIVPVCAHEFCFECILLWADQSRKCPLCSRSFDNTYLIHRIRSQHDYEKYYLPPLRSSPPPSSAERRTNAIRHTRRERQWGRRQRQEREEADQLERAIARRRWIYHHHRYAKHVASNAYTRYRPCPTPAQFAASPDLISRMTTFLRRELRVWPNLDVEFLTTYTISLMKSIDVRSEAAVKLLSEFLDLDSSYAPGARHVRAEHFVHELYSYLRSPYRDLNTYDQTAQYDTPLEVSPPRDIDRGNRWNAERSPSRRSRSRSDSRHPHRRINERQGRERSTEAHNEERPSRKRSPRRIPPVETHGNRPWGRRHSPPDVQGVLRNEASSAAGMDGRQHHPQGDQKNERGRAECVPVPNMGSPRGGDDIAAALGAVTRVIDGRLERSVDDNVLGGSSANASRSREHLGGTDVAPRHRTLSACVQAHLCPARATEKRVRVRASEAGPPALLLRLTDGPGPMESDAAWHSAQGEGGR